MTLCLFNCHPEFISGSELVKFYAKVFIMFISIISSGANMMFAPPTYPPPQGGRVGGGVEREGLDYRHSEPERHSGVKNLYQNITICNFYSENI